MFDAVPAVQKPLCAVCGREVDRLATCYDVLRDATIFLVQCHGATERVTVETELFVDLSSFRVGMAFATTALPEPALQLSP